MKRGMLLGGTRTEYSGEPLGRGTRFRRLYGESPLHLLILLASFALAGYAIARWWSYDWQSIAVWFIGAAVLHDLVLVPLYAVVDWILHRMIGVTSRRAGRAVNHIRVPALVSLLLLLVYWPLVLNRSHNYPLATGLSASVFLGRWLLITAVLFGASAIWFTAALWRRRRHTTSMKGEI